MTTNSEPTEPLRQRSRADLLTRLLLTCLLIIVLGFYVIGFGFVRDANGFSKRPVHFDWQNRSYELALEDLFPDRERHYDLLDRERLTHQQLELSTAGWSEASVVYLISLMIDVRIQNRHEMIVVSELSPLAHLYRGIDFWLYQHLSFSPWGNAGYR